MENLMLQPLISRKEAVSLIQQHRNNLVLKWQKLFSRKKEELVSMEKLYLPYWCFDYEYQSAQMKEKICGKVAVETWKQHTAILPDDAGLEAVAEGLPTLTANGAPNFELARKEIYWEAFGREKKRKDIQIGIVDTAVLFVPYWIGYIEGEQIDIIVVDATSGKIDLGIKDAVLEAIMASKN